MVNNRYDFIKEELEDGTIGYLFLTDNNIIYTVSFNISIYADYLNDYPCLLQNGYGLGFFPEYVTGKPDKCIHDPGISSTIEEITHDFMSSYDDNVFILFHCDSIDGKQAFRHKLFDKWYNTSRYKNEMFKHGLEVEIKTEGGESILHYIGFITKSRNKNIVLAIEELERFSVQLINHSVKNTHKKDLD